MSEKLAIEGGKPAVNGWPKRGLFSNAEKQAVMSLFDRAIKSGNAFGYNGPEEEAYCREFSGFLGGGHADAVNSGTSAVYVALRALEVKAFSEVICPPITDPGGVMPVPLCGCIPIVADAEPGSFNISPTSIEQRITRRTSAIIVAHIAGIPADMGPIMEIARAKSIPVIEDCAQAHGATYRGKLVGTLGDVAAFSTMFGKHHATGGQGGVVFTKSEELYWRARRYSDRGKPFGLEGTRGNVAASHNLNLNDLSACIGRVQLKKLPRILRARRRAAGCLIDACRRELKAVRFAGAPRRSESAHWFLMPQLDLAKLRVDKAGFVRALQAEGVPCTVSYSYVFVDQDWYRNREVFHGTAYPWSSPLYKGDPDREHPVPNVRATDEYSFTVGWHEGITVSKAKQIFNAFRKVERAYLK